MKVLSFLMVLASVLGGLFAAYHVAVIAAGLLRKKREIPAHRAQKRIAVLIPARNEEGVIPYLIESVLQQDYPRELFEVFVLPNNCTDHTDAAAEKAGARVLHIEKEVRCKAEVLDYAFKTLDKEAFDGYVVLDADNVIDKNFLQAANDALCEGYEAGQARRESKNPYRTWVSFCSSMIFVFSNALLNRSRFALGMSPFLNGTGVLYSRELVRRTGFAMRTLTEDLEYTGCCALHDARVAYIEKAVTYDEQPVTLKASYCQRRRWGYGFYQCFRLYTAKLLRKALTDKRLTCLDVAVNYCALPAQLVSLVPFVCTVLLLARGIVTDGAWSNAFWALAGGIVSMVLSGAAIVLIFYWLSGKPLKKTFPYLLTMGFFLLTYVPANLLPLVTKAPQWVQIPHTEKTAIEDLTRE